MTTDVNELLYEMRQSPDEEWAPFGDFRTVIFAVTRSYGHDESANYSTEIRWDLVAVLGLEPGGFVGRVGAEPGFYIRRVR